MMGRSDLDRAGFGGGCAVGRRRGLSPLGRATALLLLALAGLLTLVAQASAATTTHVFSPSTSFSGEGSCSFTEPGDVAVNETTGDIFVFDRANGSLNRFSATGVCLAHRHIGAKGEVGEEGNEGLAVDNDASSPSFGDVYVVDAETKRIVKLKPEGASFKVEGSLKKFRFEIGPKEFEEFEEFEEIHGLKVDAAGHLWVFEGGAFLDEFSPSGSQIGITRVEVSGGAGEARHGFAITGLREFFYVGRQRENHLEEPEEVTVAMQLNSAGEPSTEPAPDAQFDNQATSGVAVDRSNGQVYYDNGTGIASYTSSGQFVERFGTAGEQLRASSELAVDTATNIVYAADVHGGVGVVQVFVPSSSEGTPSEPKAELPDGRKYEMVSPPNKLGSTIFPISLGFGQIQAAENGSAITYVSNAPIVPAPATNRSPEPSSNLSKRGAGQWTTEDISSPVGQVPLSYAFGSGTEYEFFATDLSTGLLNPDPHEITTTHEPPLSPGATEGTPYSRSLTTPSPSCEPTPSTCYRALVSPSNNTAGSVFGDHASIESASPDGRHVVIRSNVPLLTGAPAEGLYEEEPGGPLTLISVPPPSEPEDPTELRLGGLGASNGGGVMRNAISSDGSRVIWNTNGTEHIEGPLYLRDVAKGQTIRIDVVDKEEEGKVPAPAQAGAVYQTASTDGSRIFFTDTNPLTANSTTEVHEGEDEEIGQGFGKGDLYVCEIIEEAGKDRCKITDVTARLGEQPAANESAAVQGVLGASEDGTTVYFVANGILATQAGQGRCVAREGGQIGEEIRGKLPVLNCSLYSVHLSGGQWERPRFIATLTTQDARDWAVIVSIGSLGSVTSRVSPNGEYAAFMSNRPLTGYNNVDTHTQAKGARDEEVFIYSAAANSVQCASCNPSKEPPAGVFDKNEAGEGLGLLVDRKEDWASRWLAGNVPGWSQRSKESAVYQSRYLSDNGRLFFNSADALVPAAKGTRTETINGEAVQVGVERVYEFEPNGTGTCASATGCISLLSSPAAAQESAFLDASVEGLDAFFLTATRLIPTLDTDSGFDIYNARACSAGSPCFTAPGEPEEPCKGEACKPAQTSQAALPPVPPTTVPGPGNNGTVEVLGAKENKSPVKVITRKEKLKKALKACKKIKKKRKRASCERTARKKYGPLKKGKKASVWRGGR